MLLLAFGAASLCAGGGRCWHGPLGRTCTAARPFEF